MVSFVAVYTELRKGAAGGRDVDEYYLGAGLCSNAHREKWTLEALSCEVMRDAAMHGVCTAYKKNGGLRAKGQWADILAVAWAGGRASKLSQSYRIPKYHLNGLPKEPDRSLGQRRILFILNRRWASRIHGSA